MAKKKVVKKAVPKKTTKKKSKAGTATVKLISTYAQTIRKPGEKWTDTIKRASTELRKKGKI